MRQRVSTRARERIDRETSTIRKTAMRKERDDTTKCIVDPRTSTWLPYWDAVTGSCLAFTAVGTPYEVSFLAPTVPMFWVNRGVDMVFAIDCSLNFFLAYPADAEQSQEGAHWVTSRGRIAKHYLFGWFALDIFSVLTFLFDRALGALEPVRRATPRRPTDSVGVGRATSAATQWPSTCPKTGDRWTN